MPYSTAIRKEMQLVNGILRSVDVEYQRLDDVEPEVERLAEKLFAVTNRLYGSLAVPLAGQPSEVRDYHHQLARAALDG